MTTDPSQRPPKRSSPQGGLQHPVDGNGSPVPSDGVSEMTDAELSEAVAVEVMGWVDDTERGGAPKTTWAFWRAPEQKGDLGTFWHDGPPSFASDIAAAMEVFERVCVAPGVEHAGIEYIRGWEAGDSVYAVSIVGRVPTIEADHETNIPRAICEAALLWARNRNSA